MGSRVSLQVVRAGDPIHWIGIVTKGELKCEGAADVGQAGGPRSRPARIKEGDVRRAHERTRAAAAGKENDVWLADCAALLSSSSSSTTATTSSSTSTARGRR
jgi:hypothetical protein